MSFLDHCIGIHKSDKAFNLVISKQLAFNLKVSASNSFRVQEGKFAAVFDGKLSYKCNNSHTNMKSIKMSRRNYSRTLTNQSRRYSSMNNRYLI